MITLHAHRLADVDVAALRNVAARQGWLIETPEILRAGVGRALVEFTCDGGLDAVPSCQEFFATVNMPTEFESPTSRPVAFAAVPFRRNQPWRMWIPEHLFTVNRAGDVTLLSVSDHPRDALQLLLEEPGRTDNTEYQPIDLVYSPSPDGYARAVAAAVQELRHSELDKVVLARRVTGRVDGAIDPAVVIARLHEREPVCTLFAMPTMSGQRFVGASPELLVALADNAVTAHPLAGTVALSDQAEADDYAAWLLGSTKNLYEHRVVVDDIVNRLRPRCEDVRADETPSVVILRSVAHLGTWINGTVRSDSTNALELLELLHPTPAVGGLPQRRALDLIERLEPEDRGLYAGAVGWMDTAGDGEWWIAIRGVLVDGENFTAWAGAGIVADSDPIGEREETRNKLSSILAGLGTSAL